MQGGKEGWQGWLRAGTPLYSLVWCLAGNRNKNRANTRLDLEPPWPAMDDLDDILQVLNGIQEEIDEVAADLDAARIQLKGLTAPIRESKGAQALGAGDEAADALVDVMKQIGVLS